MLSGYKVDDSFSLTLLLRASEFSTTGISTRCLHTGLYRNAHFTLLCIATSTSNTHVCLAESISFLFTWAEFSELLISPNSVLCLFQVRYALVIKLLLGSNLGSNDVYGKFLSFFNGIQVLLTLFIKVDAFISASLINLFVLCVFRSADTVCIEGKKMLCRFEIQSCFLLAFLAVTAFFISDAQGQGKP